MDTNEKLQLMRQSYTYRKRIKSIVIDFITLIPAVGLLVFAGKKKIVFFVAFLIFTLLASYLLVKDLVLFIKMRIAPQDYVIYNATVSGGAIEEKVTPDTDQGHRKYYNTSFYLRFTDEDGAEHSIKHKETTNYSPDNMKMFDKKSVTVGYDKKRNRYFIDEKLTDLFT